MARQRGGLEQTKQIFRHYRALYGACSEDVLVQRSAGYKSESGYHRMRVDERIRFEYATCGRGNFLNSERKSCRFKNIRIRVDEALETQRRRAKNVVESCGLFYFPSSSQLKNSTLQNGVKIVMCLVMPQSCSQRP